MRTTLAVLTLLALAAPGRAQEEAAAWADAASRARTPEQASQFSAFSFDRPAPQPVRPARAGAQGAAGAATPASSVRGALTARMPIPGLPSERKPRGFLGALLDYATGLVKLPLLGGVRTLENLVKAPFRMVDGLKEGRVSALLIPGKAVLDVAWNVTTLAVAEANHAVAPAYALFDPAQGPGEVKDEGGMVWTSGGPAGGILGALDKPRFRYFMPSQVLVFGDKAQIDCDCNPANPGDPYDTNAVNALHEVILKDKFTDGYFTDFAVPWAVSPAFRRREEDAAMQEAIRRLHGR